MVFSGLRRMNCGVVERRGRSGEGVLLGGWLSGMGWGARALTRRRFAAEEGAALGGEIYREAQWV